MVATAAAPPLDRAVILALTRGLFSHAAAMTGFAPDRG